MPFNPRHPAFTTLKTTIKINNAIEDFGSEEFAIRRPRSITPYAIRHREHLDSLQELRRNLCHDNQSECEALRDLEKIISNYHAAVRRWMDEVDVSYEQECTAIKDTIRAHREDIGIAFTCHTSREYIRARLDIAKAKKHLIKETTALRDQRKNDLLEAQELMYRQLIMNAFVNSRFGKSIDSYKFHGIHEGCLSDEPVQVYHLRKVVDENLDGVYCLSLAWIPAPGATMYPAKLLVDRTNQGQYRLQEPVWVNYDDDDERDIESRYPPRTIAIEATIRCEYVDKYQSDDRATIERADMNEKQYKRSLLPWKRIFYKAGDYKKTQASSSRPATN